jgi:isochorismate synthase
VTAVRPSARLDDHGAPALDQPLAARLSHAAGGLAAVTSPVPAIDPIALFAAAVEADLEAALWLQPTDGRSFVGIGRVWATETDGPDRFAQAEREWRELLRTASVADASPVLIGGLGFTGRRPAGDDVWAPFGPASLVLPELLLASSPDGATVTAAAIANEDGLGRRWAALERRARELEPSPNGMVARPVVAPLTVVGEHPDRDAWDRLVGQFAGAVGRGRIDKVVLARRVDLRSPLELDVPNALRRLAASAPESTIYAFRRAGCTVLGATPERLARTEGRSFRTMAVAGSIRRGADAAEDAALAAELLASEKDREEQAIVVEAIRDQLTPIAETLIIAPEPSVMRLRFVQHLATEITGTLPEARGLLSLAGLLHPTPAVGGQPRDVALAMVDEHEGFDRGWYAGPIGWLGADDDGELCVALRCGIVDHTRATLFAGCGIVADSDPAAEWEESRIKLRAVVSALGIPADES